MTSDKTSIVSGVKWTSVSSVCTTIAKLLQIVILSRFLTKADFGIIGIALMCINFSEIFMDLGISSGVMHVQGITKRQYSSLFWLNVFTGIVVYAVFAGLSPLIAIYYKEAELESVLPCIFLIIIISSFYRLQRTIQFKEMRFKFIAFTEISSNVLMLFFSVVFAFLGWGVYSLVWSTVVFYAYLAIIYLGYSLIKLKNITFHYSNEDLKPFLKIGLFQLGNSLIDTISSELDTIIIGRVFSLEILGVYTLCKQLSCRIYGFINPIITKVLTPALAIIQDNISLVKQKYMQTLYIIAIINISIYAYIAYMSPNILSILYGSQYADYYMVLSLLCVYFSILCVGNPIGALQVALGRTDLGFYWTLYRVASYALALYVGCLFNDINICVLCLVLVTILNIYPSNEMLLKKMIGLRLVEYLDVYKIPTLISLALGFVSFIHLFGWNDIINLIVAGVVFFSLYVLILFRARPTLYQTILSIVFKR